MCWRLGVKLKWVSETMLGEAVCARVSLELGCSCQQRCGVGWGCGCGGGLVAPLIQGDPGGRAWAAPQGELLPEDLAPGGRAWGPLWAGDPAEMASEGVQPSSPGC